MDKLTNNSLAFIALCNEYCSALENAESYDKKSFVKSMLKILPRLYISASDLEAVSDDSSIDSALTEDYYDSIRSRLEAILGENDVYLEVFEEDMKYSDTPIAVSVSEGLADLFQVFYNFVEAVKDSPMELVMEALSAMKFDFENYWSQKLCNILRPLNDILYNDNNIDIEN